MEAKCEVKIILLGESGVGKTSLSLRFIENKFRGTQSRTIINKYEKVIEIKGNLIKLVLWDTAGREAYYNVVKSYYKVADGALLVYDAQNANSFQELSKWFADFKSTNENAEILIAGNKSEDGNNISINVADMEKFLRNKKVDCIDVSAKLNKNVNILFHNIVQKILVAKGILPHSNDDQLTEVSKSEISSASTSPQLDKNIHLSSLINATGKTESLVNCKESTKHHIYNTVNSSSTAKCGATCKKQAEYHNSNKTCPSTMTESLSTCVKSAEDHALNKITPSTTTESPDSCVNSADSHALNKIVLSTTTKFLGTCDKSIEHHTSNKSDASNSTESLATCVKSTENHTLKKNDPSTTTESQITCVEAAERNISNTLDSPNAAESPTTCVESTIQHLSSLTSGSSFKANPILLMPNEIYELDDDEDSSLNDYGFQFLSMDKYDKTK